MNMLQELLDTTGKEIVRSVAMYIGRLWTGLSACTSIKRVSAVTYDSHGDVTAPGASEDITWVAGRSW